MADTEQMPGRSSGARTIHLSQVTTELQQGAISQSQTEPPGSTVAMTVRRAVSLDQMRRVADEFSSRTNIILDQEISFNSRSLVMSAKHPFTADPVAVKFICLDGPWKTDATMERAVSDFRTGIAVHHPNVIRYFDVALIDAGSTRAIALIMELCHGSAQKLRALSQPSRNIAIGGALLDATNGLIALHASGRIHSDIKPANILVIGNRWSVADLECAVPAGEPPTGYTLAYASEEQLSGRPLSWRTDAFGIGATAYWLHTGKSVRGRQGQLLSDDTVRARVSPPWADLIIACCLQSSGRLRNLSQVRDHLQALAVGRTRGPLSASRVPSWVAVLAGALGVAIMAASLVIALQILR
jgi:serine/threonine protein kinase